VFTFFFLSLFREQLREFSDKVIDTKAAGYHVPQYAGAAGAGLGGGASGSNAQMEVDSNASTPA
jgi:hypothetical protein